MAFRFGQEVILSKTIVIYYEHNRRHRSSLEAFLRDYEPDMSKAFNPPTEDNLLSHIFWKNKIYGTPVSVFEKKLQ